MVKNFSLCLIKSTVKNVLLNTEYQDQDEIFVNPNVADELSFDAHEQIPVVFCNTLQNNSNIDWFV